MKTKKLDSRPLEEQLAKALQIIEEYKTGVRRHVWVTRTVHCSCEYADRVDVPPKNWPGEENRTISRRTLINRKPAK